MAEYLRVTGYQQPILGIIEKINETYTSGSYVCLDLLTRKLLETLLIQVLLRNPGPTAVWVDSSSDHRKTLDTMIRTFWEYMDTAYKPFAAQYDKESLTTIRNIMWELKKIGDQQAHSLLSCASQTSAETRRNDVQMMVDFLWDLRDKIPESIVLGVENETLDRNAPIRVAVDHIPVLPNAAEVRRLGVMTYTSSIIFTIEAIKEPVDCRVYVRSKSQAMGFRLDYPVNVSCGPFGLRKRETQITLDGVIKERLDPACPREFKFEGVLRPAYLGYGQKTMTIFYKIDATCVQSGKAYDHGERRIVFDIGAMEYAKMHSIQLGEKAQSKKKE